MICALLICMALSIPPNKSSIYTIKSTDQGLLLEQYASLADSPARGFFVPGIKSLPIKAGVSNDGRYCYLLTSLRSTGILVTSLPFAAKGRSLAQIDIRRIPDKSSGDIIDLCWTDKRTLQYVEQFQSNGIEPQYRVVELDLSKRDERIVKEGPSLSGIWQYNRKHYAYSRRLIDGLESLGAVPAYGREWSGVVSPERVFGWKDGGDLGAVDSLLETAVVHVRTKEGHRELWTFRQGKCLATLPMDTVAFQYRIRGGLVLLAGQGLIRIYDLSTLKAAENLRGDMIVD